MADDDIIEVYAIVKGQVQGVGFRAAARNYAQHLNLVGTARNLADGSVEIYVQGKSQDVHQLLKKLRENSGLGYVEEITTKDIFPHRPYEGFRIIH